MRKVKNHIQHIKTNAGKTLIPREVAGTREIDIASLENVTGGWSVSITFTIKF
jgi:hypothetical protein